MAIISGEAADVTILDLFRVHFFALGLFGFATFRAGLFSFSFFRFGCYPLFLVCVFFSFTCEIALTYIGTFARR